MAALRAAWTLRRRLGLALGAAAVLCAVFPLPTLGAPAPEPAPALESYARSVTLEPGTALLFWSVDETRGTIAMALHARTTGWVAVGISEVGAMVGSDVMLGWVANGTAYMTDRFIFSKSFDGSGVALDQSQDVRIVAGMEAANASTGETWTTLHFTRPLNTSDCNDRAILPGEHVSLIWAMGATDEVGYHGASKGGTTVVLRPGNLFAIAGRQVPPTTPSVASKPETKAAAELGRSLLVRKSLVAGAPAPAPSAPIASTIPFSTTPPADTPGSGSPATLVQTDSWLNLTATNYQVSTNYTTYICNAFNLSYSERKHVSEFGVILNSTHPQAVHHIVVGACSDSETPNKRPNYECFLGGGCSNYFAVWAIGGLPVVLPPAAGLPVGPGGYQRLVLQIHYTNPAGTPTIVDNSGMYFRLSPTLRQYDAGVADFGPSFTIGFIKIPPGQPAWTQDTVCPSACTARLANNSENTGTNITVFASMMHQHELGKQLYTDLYRDGVKLFTIGRQDYYDFAYQQYKDLSPGFYVLPGDELRTRCVWDSSQRSTITLGGLATTDEMCINYLLYYPARKSFRSCFNFCMPAQGKTGPLVSVASCGKDLLPLNATCPSDYFGKDNSFEPASGCSNKTTNSLESLDVSTISVPATTLPAPSPSMASSQQIKLPIVCMNALTGLLGLAFLM